MNEYGGGIGWVVKVRYSGEAEWSTIRRVGKPISKRSVPMAEAVALLEATRAALVAASTGEIDISDGWVLETARERRTTAHSHGREVAQRLV